MYHSHDTIGAGRRVGWIVRYAICCCGLGEGLQYERMTWCEGFEDVAVEIDFRLLAPKKGGQVTRKNPP